jgi:hydroxyacylglutathione hydrolase
MKRALLIIGVVLVLLLIPIVVIGVSTFGGITELVDAVELPGGARLVKDGYVSIGVLPAGDGAVALIDCGNDPNGIAVMKELQRRGLGPDAVKTIFLTHGHPDHIAACHLFKGSEVLAFAGDVAVAEGTGRSKGPVPSKFDTPPEKRTKVTRPLIDGETVVVNGALSVKVYAVPGHTAGSAAFLAGEALYLGDSATGGSDGKVLGAPWVFSDDQAENRRSLVALAAKLKGEGAVVKKIVFSHSGPFEGVDALLAFEAKK